MTTKTKTNRSSNHEVMALRAEMARDEIEDADRKREEALRLLTIAERKYRAHGREDDADRCVRATKPLAK